MKTIKIKEIHITNFKCYEKASFKFNADTTVVKGITGYGKTTIKDAYLWSLGFDCNFAPKINDALVRGIDTCIETILSVDGIEYCLRRTNIQKWKFNEDKGIEEFVGNDSKFEIDNEKQSATAFKTKVAELFDLSNHFYVKLIADLNAFNVDNGTKWTWKERRAFLFSLLDIDKKTKNLSTKKDFGAISEYLAKGKDEDEISKAINAETKAITDKQKAIKFSIDNNNKKIAELSKIDFKYLESELARIEQDIADTNKKAFDKKVEINRQIIELKNSINRNKELAGIYEEEEKRLKDQSEATFREEIANKCPTCGRRFEKTKLVALKASFELEKLSKIAQLNENAENSAEKARNLRNRVLLQENELQALEGQYSELYEVSEGNLQVDNELYNLKTEYEAIKEQLSTKKVIEMLKNDNEDLKTQLKSVLNSQKEVIAKKTALKKYVEEKIALTNTEISKVFKNIGFKFYKYNTANAENEYQPTCECLLNGVAYNNLSQGQRIIADFDTNNGLQKLLGLNVPQIIDNKQDNTFSMESKNQKVELVTCNETNINARFVRDIYSDDDCDKKGE